MYQVNIPMIYTELETKNSSEMGKVILYGSSVVVFFYSLVGIFGYAIFVNNEIALCPKNILEADFHGN
jgi:amino acid permease